MSQGLTTHQANLLAFLRSSERTPSYAEMTRAIGLKARSHIYKILNGLEDRGYIERLPNKSRAVRLLAEPRAWHEDEMPLSEYKTERLLDELRRRGVKLEVI